jgi:hypothetical protein
MKYLSELGLLILLTFLPGLAIAWPIKTDTFLEYPASWAMSTRTRCSDVCRGKNAVAESMKLSRASSEDIFICRVSGKRMNSFGTNSSDNCLYYDITSRKPVKATDFECLCVKKATTTEKMSREECMRKLKQYIDRNKLSPSKEVYRKAVGYCRKGDLRRAVNALR